MRKISATPYIAPITNSSMHPNPRPSATPQHMAPLIEQIAGVENLTCAWQKVKRNIRRAQRPFSSGRDDISITAFESAWTEQMTTLARELLNSQYHPLPARHVLLNKRDGGQRTIAILAVRDRIAQRAVHQILEPKFDSAFQPCSYGCRPYVGAPHAIMAAERYIKQGKAWVVHADVVDFFPNINHKILMSLVQKTVKEQAVLQLIENWLQVGLLSHTDSQTRNAAQKGHASQMAQASNSGDASAWWEGGEDILEQAVEWEAQQPTNNLNPGDATRSHLTYHHPFSQGSNSYQDYYAYPQDQDYPEYHGYQEYQVPAAYSEYPDQWSYGPRPDTYPGQSGLNQLRQSALSGLRSNLASLLASYAKPALTGLHNVLPLIGRSGASHLALGSAGLAGVTAATAATAATALSIPLIYRILHRNGRISRRGALQGGALSPLLANIYLDYFDRAMTRRGYTVVRYVDDFLILCGSRAEAEDALRDARSQLGRLRLGLNESKTILYPPQSSVFFLGHRFRAAQPPTHARTYRDHEYPDPGHYGQSNGWTSFEAAEKVLKRTTSRPYRPMRARVQAIPRRGQHHNATDTTRLTQTRARSASHKNIRSSYHKEV